MHFSPARWTAAIAAAALIALPGSALAQSAPPQNPPSQPPTQSQPPAQPQATAPAGSQPDASAAKQHLTEARNALSQLTSMPEAAKLQGDARTKVSELISNFNALITAQSEWRAAYGKVNDSLTSLIGPDTEQPAAGTTGTAGAGTAATTGTTGTSAAAAGNIQLDPAIRAKLVEFRSHLNEFEKAAGGSTPAAESKSTSMPPTAATASTSNPANPATAASPPAENPPAANPPASAASGAVGTSGTGSSEMTGPTGTTGTEASPTRAAQSELAAIDAILAESKAGTLTKTQTAELKRHIEALHALLK